VFSNIAVFPSLRALPLNAVILSIFTPVYFLRCVLAVSGAYVLFSRNRNHK